MAIELNPDERRVTMDALTQFVDAKDCTSEAMAADESLGDDEWVEVEHDYDEDITTAVGVMEKLKEDQSDNPG
jgi:hypothetical protein